MPSHLADREMHLPEDLQLKNEINLDVDKHKKQYFLIQVIIIHYDSREFKYSILTLSMFVVKNNNNMKIIFFKYL